MFCQPAIWESVRRFAKRIVLRNCLNRKRSKSSDSGGILTAQWLRGIFGGVWKPTQISRNFTDLALDIRRIKSEYSQGGSLKMIRDALLPEFDHEMANTRKTLERCPEDKFGWKPHPKSFSMASLATHIANMTGWTVDTINKDSFDVAPPGAPPYKEEPASSSQELL